MAITTPDTVNLDEQLGQRVHTMLWQQRISQTAAADELGISQSALSRSLRGERKWRISEVVALASLLKVTLDDLLPRLDSNQQPVGLRIAAAAWTLVNDWTQTPPRLFTVRNSEPRIPLQR